jgi:hypothetical protein
MECLLEGIIVLVLRLRPPRAVLAHSGFSDVCCVAFLQTLQSSLLRYNSPVKSDQEAYFSCARNLVVAQFQLADQELTQRLWQDVADRHLDVDRIIHLMYRCRFHDDNEAFREADDAFVALGRQHPSQASETAVGVFEHC